MKFPAAVIALLLLAPVATGTSLPGFRVQLIQKVPPFVSSLAVDSRGIIYYTVTSGTVFRFADGVSMPVARVTTDAVGNSGLLGMALIDDDTAAIHYTTPRQTYDIIARVDLRSGEVTELHAFACDIDVPERGAPSEHHGGNPTVAPDGSIFVGIGDYGGGLIASLEKWNGGKIFRVFPDGTATQFARGLRNPFDLAWDDAKQHVIVADNGPVAGDELNVISEHANCGWPFTFGNQPPIPGAVSPDYVFDKTVAPTGMVALNAAVPPLSRGYLLGGFVSKAIYYFTDVDRHPIQPITLIESETGPIIDVAQRSNGEIYFTTGNAIYRLQPPLRGDCNGDGRVDSADFDALRLELEDGGTHDTITAQDGAYRGSWGCDANGDNLIDAADFAELGRLASWRRRAAGRGQ